jgi:hypothetical protein
LDIPIVDELFMEHKFINCCLSKLRMLAVAMRSFLALYIKSGIDFDGGLPVADAFRMKVLEGEILVICVDSNLDPFEKTTIFFESLETRQ